MKKQVLAPEQDLSPEKLKAEIQDLKKQLDDCLKSEVRVQYSSRLSWSLRHISNAIFLPSYEYDQGSGRRIRHKYSTWMRLQYLLLEKEHFGPLWSNHSFRMAIIDLNAVVESLFNARAIYDEKTDNISKYDVGDAGDRVVFCGEREHQGTLMIRQAVIDLYKFKEEDRMDLEIEELDELYISLTIIIQCQKIYRQSKEQEA